MISKILAIMLIVTATASALVSTQNALASICPPMCVDILEEEAAVVENSTMTNQTADGNVTSNNSTS